MYVYHSALNQYLCTYVSAFILAGLATLMFVSRNLVPDIIYGLYPADISTGVTSIYVLELKLMFIHVL